MNKKRQTPELFINNQLHRNTAYFGSWVRRIRKKRGYSQSQLAMAVGRSVGWICGLEKGERGRKLTDPTFYIALAEYLNVPLEAVLEAANIPKTREDEKYNEVLRMVRNRAIAQRIVNIVESLDTISNSINVETTDYGAKIRHMSETLQILIQDLKSALKII